MLERLSSNVEHQFWKGQDIEIATDLTLDRVARVPFIIRPDSLPPMDGLSPDVLNFFHGSVRSRYAQLGLDLDEDVGLDIANAIFSNKDVHEPFYVDVVLLNRSSRLIHLPKGSHLFRLYHDLAGSAVFGKELVSMEKTGNIRIDGRFGLDWMWAYDKEDSNKSEDVVGIRVRIEDFNRRWIPPHPEGKPISIHDTEPNYREEIDRLLVDVPRTNERILWIGQTKKISLRHVEAVLDKDVLPDVVDKAQEGWGFQINSRLIDRERTNWPVRVEVLSSTSKALMPNFVTLHFFQRFSR